MISRLQIENFKSIKRADLTFGKVNVFIGTNASGKSNLFDALQVLRGFGYGLSVHEALDGKSATDIQREVPGIRGGSANAVFGGNSKPNKNSRNDIQFRIEFDYQHKSYSYATSFQPLIGKFSSEVLRENAKELFSYTRKNGNTQAKALDKKISLHTHSFEKPLAFADGNLLPDSLAEKKAGRLFPLLSVASHIRHEFELDVLRDYAQVFSGNRNLGAKGEGFPNVVSSILKDRKRRDDFNSWIQELSPEQFQEATTLAGASNDELFALVENGVKHPAKILSDGTLRFCAIAASLFQELVSNSMLFEEIENGIHPARLRLLMELVQSRAKVIRSQIFLTTHSPLVLNWLDEEYYSSTYVFKRGKKGESIVRRITDFERFNELRKKKSIGELFAQGWFESFL